MTAPLPQELLELRTAVDECMDRDRHRLRRRLDQLTATPRQSSQSPESSRVASLRRQIEHSRYRRAVRERQVPTVHFNDALPVSARRDDIAKLVRENQVCIIAGATGSGKSTQLPKVCLALGRGVGALIGHTQPRRIAARSIAARLSSELRTAPGTAVGYKVRFDDTVSDDSYVKVMTDGVLLGEVNEDRLFRQYDTLIIDEAHERSLNIDFLLGYLKRILPKRPDLKVIITSATINTEKFSLHFNNAPVLEIEGRGYPVEIEYAPPLVEEGANAGEVDLVSAVEQSVCTVRADKPGDVLVFLPGEREIREVSTRLTDSNPQLEVLPLFGRMDHRQQDRVFAAGTKPKVVLATNVAETSLTVPGIRYVIDCGLVRTSRYSHRNKMQRLPTERVSKASADQRAGRCGRTGPGRCIRLFTETEYDKFRDFSDPEIRRTNLAAVILRMKSLDLGDVEQFPFIDPPDARFVRDGLRLLSELQALDDRGQLTLVGEQLARLPVDPRIGAMVLAAARFGSLHEVLIIAAAMSVQDPLACMSENRLAAARARRHIEDKHSDLIVYLNAWRQFEKLEKKAGPTKLRRLCRSLYVSWRRLGEWRDVHAQLVARAHELDLKFNERRASHAAIHQALLTGSLGQIGRRSSRGDYHGARGTRFVLSPGSALCDKKVSWIMAAEIVETRRVYAHRACRLRAEWLEQCAPEQLLKRTYAAPYFDRRKGIVFANEHVQLHGLPIVTGRKRPYDAVDPAQARRVFIASALVGGLIESDAAFLKHNRELVERLERLAEKARRTDILADELRMVEFYEQRVPLQIARTTKFERWLNQIEQTQPKLLYMTEADVRDTSVSPPSAALFPDQMIVNAHRFPVRYRFAPGAADDGATVTLPTVLMNQLNIESFEWGVSGWLEEKVEALLRGLAKPWRRRLVPLPECVAWCMAELRIGEGGLLGQLTRIIELRYGVNLPAGVWRQERLAPYLRLNFQLLNNDLRPSVSGRDLSKFKARFASLATLGFDAIAPPTWERDGVVEWDFELPSSIEFKHGPMTLTGFPTLIDNGDSVRIRLADNADTARRESLRGTERLAWLRLSPKIKRLRRALPRIERIRLLYSSVPPAPHSANRAHCENITDDILSQAFQICLIDLLHEPIRKRSAFEAWITAGVADLTSTANELCELLADCLERYHELRARLAELETQAPAESLADIDQHLSSLINQGIVSRVGLDRLRQFPRYLEGLQCRTRKLSTAANKDLKRLRRLHPVEQRIKEALSSPPLRHDAQANAFRWELEELRIALFAQETGARVGTSLEGVCLKWKRNCDRVSEEQRVRTAEEGVA